MIKRCLDTGTPFGILPGALSRNDLGTLAHITNVSRMSADGRCEVTVTGVQRFRVSDLWMSANGFGLHEGITTHTYAHLHVCRS
jgi:Lon protease-like protein